MLKAKNNEFESYGKRLKDRRLETQRSIDEVADAILLSKNQINGLENGETWSFYGEKHFICAMKKYATLFEMDIDEALFSRIITLDLAHSRIRNTSTGSRLANLLSSLFI